jgi:hypothetical protein
MVRIATLLLLGVLGCSGSEPAGAQRELAGPEAQVPVTLRNATGVPIVYLAAGEGTLALLLIPARLQPGEFGTRIVPAGESVPVHDILGYLPDLGVNFHIYRVDSVRGDAAFAGSFLATAAELARAGGLVTLTPSRF